MQESRESLLHLNKSDLGEIKSLETPPKPVEKVFSGFSIVFGQNPDWQSAQSLLSDPDIFKRAADFKVEDLPSNVLEKLKSIVNDPNINEEALRNTSIASLYIFRWLRALCNFAQEDKNVEEFKQEAAESTKKEGEDIVIDDGIIMEMKVARQDEELLELDAAREALKMVEIELANTSFDCLHNKTDRVAKVIDALCVILGEEPSWENGMKLLENREQFLNRLKGLNIEEIPQQNIDKVRVWLQDPELRMNLIQNDCPAACDLLLWINAATNYWVVSSILERGDAALSENAEEDAKKQESEIIRSHSKILDEGENMTEEDRERLKELEKRPSIEELI